MSVAFAASVPKFEDPALRLGKEFPQFTKTASGDDALCLPSLRERLGVIAAQVYTYEYKEPLSEDMTKVLEAINQLFEDGGE
jgi:hypothetical protein